MMWTCFIYRVFFSFIILKRSNGISSPIQPFTEYKHSTELQANISDLWWTIDDAEREIVFELHVKTTGWIALGISPAGGMTGADIGVGWIDQTGTVQFQDRYAYNRSRPVIDYTTTDWFALQGREQDGWTAIQFRRLLETCDSMDVPIKSGTNILIYAYGLVDPDGNGEISYHESRRGSRMLPLRYYIDQLPQTEYADLDSFELRINHSVPVADTTYYCKVFKTQITYPTKRHVIAHKILLDSNSREFVHHMSIYECDPSTQFDNTKLPDDVCDDIRDQISLCSSTVVTVWSVGGDEIMTYPEEAGYPVGGDFTVNYYMIELHYDNPRLVSNRWDTTGVRFYLGDKLREHDIGYLTFGTDSTAQALAIPGGADRFIVDSYCPASASLNIPKSGITVFCALPHTHLQGQSVWTKLIRNRTAVQYLFNSEAYDFNYQFHNRFPKPIQIYPGDEFATRCIYNTKNKNLTTRGGGRTKDEMCIHGFIYYPRMNDLSMCLTHNDWSAWKRFLNVSAENFDETALQEILIKIKWTPQLVAQWQSFYDNTARGVTYGRSPFIIVETFAALPKYQDLEPERCSRACHTQISISSILIVLLARKAKTFFS
ncbi:unnamed protein product [Adineta ricciae]|uniref:DOMON domain-containing protein n=1 Tax=Adineta ricciae TaxID=249248 RepID=A0A813Z9A5_ADIRI|nr:unnamed protein product [Adineta ricciae]CAF1452047.1 unnamed protein product [Adineta ricciae]